MSRGLWAVGFSRCRLAATDCVVIGAFGALRCARLLLSVIPDYDPGSLSGYLIKVWCDI